MNIRVLCTTIALLTTTGCGIMTIRNENLRLTAMGEIDGHVSFPESRDLPIIVVLLREDRLVDDKPVEEVQSSAVLYRPGNFHFWAERGRYNVFAFVDENQNLKFDPGEPNGFFGARTPTDVQMEEGLVLTDVDFAISAQPALRPVAFEPGHDALRTLDDLKIGDAMGKKGMWAPGEFRKASGDDALYLMEPYDPNKTPVVFVHGIGGCPSNMRPLIEKLDRTHFQPWLFWYASGKRFSSSAQSLRARLDELRVVHPFDSVVIVAQSAGGIVARETVSMLQQSDHHFGVSALVTLSTPWAGHHKAAWGVRMSLMVLPAWHDMAPDSPFQIRQVTTQLPWVRHYMFFSYGAGKTNDSEDGSVALSSELELNMQRGATEVLGFPETHMGIITNADAQNRFNEVLTKVRAEVAGP
jgi:pimeloyl-ACP methyl ester carboxylesterase